MSTRKTFLKCFRASNLLRKEGAGGFYWEMYWPTSFRRDFVKIKDKLRFFHGRQTAETF